MTQFLFVAEIPPLPNETYGVTEAPAWTQFAHAVSATLKPVRGSKPLQKNVWLLPAENIWPVLMELSSTAEKHHLAYSIALVGGDVTLLTKPFKGA